MRARAKQANLETKKANEILLAFKKLDAQRELEADAAIAGQCAALCCAVLCWPPSDAVLAGFSESAAAVVISSKSNSNVECYSRVYGLASSHASEQRQAKGPAQRYRSSHLAKAVLLLCRGLCSAL